MDHETALNLLLANACPKGMDEKGEEREFELDLHCTLAKVKAELVSTVGSIQFKIISVEMETN